METRFFYQFGEETGLLTDGLVLNQIRFALEIKLRQFMIFLDQQELRIRCSEWLYPIFKSLIQIALAKKRRKLAFNQVQRNLLSKFILGKQDQLQLSFGDELSFGL